MFGPPISQSAWIVNTRTSRSWYSGSIFAKSLASILSVNAMSASFSVQCLTLVHWKDDDRAPLGAGHDAQGYFPSPVWACGPHLSCRVSVGPLRRPDRCHAPDGAENPPETDVGRSATVAPAC